jgi:hypothetical protein
VTALREKYFIEEAVNAKDFDRWKPDELHEGNAKTRRSVDLNRLPHILVVGMYQILNSMRGGGDYISLY